MLVLCLCGWMAASPAFGETLLVKDGRPLADIVTAEKPPRMVKLAAEELQTYIEKITGAKLAISNTPGPDVPAHIYVGRSAYTDKLNITDEGLKHGAFKMLSGEDWLALVGHDSDYTPPMPFYDHYKYCGVGRSRNFDEYLAKEWDPDLEARARQQSSKIDVEKWGSPYMYVFKQYSRTLGIWESDERGSLNAVYAFLRDQGVRWYLPGDLGEIVPKKTSLELPRVDKTVRPDFAMRNPFQFFKTFWSGSKDEILWQLRMGFNLASDIIGSDYGVGIEHGLSYMINRDEMTQTHPEYYAKNENGSLVIMRHGRRDPLPCLSSPELLASNVKYIRALFDFYGEPMVSVMMPEGYTATCQCKLCKNKGTPERGLEGCVSDYVWDYVNRVAQEVYKTHPDKKISCNAYGAYRLPPTKIDQLSPNIVVGLTQHRSTWLNDYIDPKKKEQTLSLRQEWLKKIPKGHTPFFVYDYYSDGFGSPDMTPVFFPHTIAADLRALKGISMGDYIETYSGWNSKSMGQYLGVTLLNLYVTAQFLWDTDQDVDRLLGEYYTLFYGPAAAEMKAFVDYGEANSGFLEKNADKLGQAIALLEKAQAKVAHDSVYAKRIALIADNMRPMKDIWNQSAFFRGAVPIAVGGAPDAKDLKLDGKLDDVFWQDLKTYPLRELTMGRKAHYQTTFKVAWAGDNLYFGIECKDAARTALASTVTGRDDLKITEGEEVEIMLETQNHAYYQFAISPAGGLFDADWKKGLEPQWNSNAEVYTHVDRDTWSIEIRIPVMNPKQEKIKPMLCVAGDKPSASAPWYFNVCRQSIHGQDREFSAFSPPGSGSFHVRLKFGKLYVK